MVRSRTVPGEKWDTVGDMMMKVKLVVLSRVLFFFKLFIYTESPSAYPFFFGVTDSRIQACIEITRKLVISGNT